MKQQQRFQETLNEFIQMKDHSETLEEPPSFDMLFQLLEQHMSNIPVQVQRNKKPIVLTLDKVKASEMLAYIKQCMLQGKEPVVLLNER